MVNWKFRFWNELSQVDPQEFVLGTVLLNIYLNDLFFLSEITDVCNFADDTTFYICGLTFFNKKFRAR